MTAYTVAVREKSKVGPWLFVNGADLHIQDTTNGCKPLSRDDAAQAKACFLAGAKRAGRKIDCRIVRLCGLTRDDARKGLAAIGWTLRTVDGEHRVNRKGAPEAHAYYTTDLEDAVATARYEQQRQAMLAAA